jgi:phosphoribosylformimino-5-aminoimidazole carboxamide ribotide isomerase
MELIPAIDIRGGLCVRLYQGDYDQETVYSESPSEVALHWQNVGAKRIHVVDLDGARSGIQLNFDVIRSIVNTVSIPIQVGGGIRSFDRISLLLETGIQRVILGTIAVTNPQLVEDSCKEFGPDAIIVGLDARDGLISVNGWRTSSSIQAITLLNQMERVGINRFIYTDISRDGTLQGPNFESIQNIQESSIGNIVASGGVSTIEHLVHLNSLGVEGAIIGQALYTGKLDFGQAIASL